MLAHLRAVPWRLDQDAFKAWRQGLTGYPLVDAGMRRCQLPLFPKLLVDMIEEYKFKASWGLPVCQYLFKMSEVGRPVAALGGWSRTRYNLRPGGRASRGTPWWTQVRLCGFLWVWISPLRHSSQTLQLQPTALVHQMCDNPHAASFSTNALAAPLLCRVLLQACASCGAWAGATTAWQVFVPPVNVFLT
jgi:hypothetical protein